MVLRSQRKCRSKRLKPLSQSGVISHHKKGCASFCGKSFWVFRSWRKTESWMGTLDLTKQLDRVISSLEETKWEIYGSGVPAARYAGNRRLTRRYFSTPLWFKRYRTEDANWFQKIFQHIPHERNADSTQSQFGWNVFEDVRISRRTKGTIEQTVQHGSCVTSFYNTGTQIFLYQTKTQSLFQSLGRLW